MTATRKIAEAETILAKMQSKSGDFISLLGVFVNTINDAFLHLLEEYNLKFDCKVDRISLEKFKVKAKRSGNIKAINFLIWYDKEYRKIRDGPLGKMLEKNYQPDYADYDGIISSCSTLLNETRAMAYYAYENF
ncbi:MAG: hypothetical protein WAO91_06365 [Candidatus Nitrosotenuis sp.]